MQWAALDALTKLGNFANLAKEMEKNSDPWQRWCQTEQAERAVMPGEYGKMPQYMQLLVIRALRPDRLTAALTLFVTQVLGEKYVSQEAFNARAVFEESSSQTPIFFILFPGYSPSQEIEALGTRFDMTPANGKLTILSMGQGQEAPAEATLDKYMKEGGWVFLENVHLMRGWLGKLERKLELAAESGHADFRCFFSAEPINGAPHANIIPESILQGCLKVSNEPPSDLKSNMRRAFAAFSEDDFARISTDEKRQDYKSLLFGLCFYHSLLLGRRKFGTGIGSGAGSGLGFCSVRSRSAWIEISSCLQCFFSCLSMHKSDSLSPTKHKPINSLSFFYISHPPSPNPLVLLHSATRSTWAISRPAPTFCATISRATRSSPGTICATCSARCSTAATSRTTWTAAAARPTWRSS